MDITDYTFIINKPDAVNIRQTALLEKILADYPYFQSARALRLKGLYNDDSYRYNNELKVTAAYTTDRSVLFDFITSDSFTAIQKGLYDQKLEELYSIVVSGMEVVIPDPIRAAQFNEAQIPAAASTTVLEEAIAIEQAEVIETKLDLGKPLDFSKDEKHSFREWLQLSQFTPIDRSPLHVVESEEPTDSDKQKKIDLINKFIESNPKIPPVKQETTLASGYETPKSDHSYLMTETLARVYLEQKKYQKAVQAYEILILKYPEKSSFFADRISDIKNLQQNNNK